MKIDIARRSMIVLVLLALIGYHELRGKVKLLFEWVVYLFTTFSVLAFVFWELYK